MEQPMSTLVIPTDSPRVYGPPQGRWTFADWEQLPDDGNKYEVIDKVLYMSAVPGNVHQWLREKLYNLVGVPARQMELGLSIYLPLGLIMRGCDPVLPDFFFVRKGRKNIQLGQHIVGPPDLIVEILPARNRAYYDEIKLAAYARAGVPEYVLVDPWARALRLYRRQPKVGYGDPQVFIMKHNVTFKCMPGLELEVNALFEDMPTINQ